MTAPISGTSSNAAAVAALMANSSSAATPETKSKNDMDRDLFLKLLVAQLKYQDPSKPADTTQFLAQTAQFTMVEKLEDLSNSQQSMLAAQLMTTATLLIGRTVTYTGTDGTDHTGVVASATISGSNPTVKVANMDVALSSVKEVRPTTSTTSP